MGSFDVSWNRSERFGSYSSAMAAIPHSELRYALPTPRTFLGGSPSMAFSKLTG